MHSKCSKVLTVIYILIYFSGLYPSFKKCKISCRMHSKCSKVLTVYNCMLRSLWKALKPSIKSAVFNNNALFEQRTKLFYMILLLADARWRHTACSASFIAMTSRMYPCLPQAASRGLPDRTQWACQTDHRPAWHPGFYLWLHAWPLPSSYSSLGARYGPILTYYSYAKIVCVCYVGFRRNWRTTLLFSKLC